MFMIRCLILCFALMIFQVQAKDVMVGHFSSGEMKEWEPKIFNKLTDYQLVSLKGKKVLQAQSHDSASGLVKKIKIDLNKTPYLNWSWKINNTITGINEKNKNGDDYPGRVYVIFSPSIFIWKTRAINYVWSGNQPIDSHWDNAYTDKNLMIAIQGKDSPVGQWLKQKRNIKADFQQYFQLSVEQIDAVAIMSDSDNSHGQASAYFGDIYFSAD